jgi:hypothetical protein
MAYTTIDDPSAYFHIQFWTGNGTSQTITNNANAGDFSPDWVWIKNRSSSGGAGPQIIWNTTRTKDREFHLNTTEAEHTTTNGITAFNANGFDLGNGGTVNENTSSFVSWQWKANGNSRTSYSASGNQLAGDFQANTTAGFSIITYSGNATNGATVQHGLGATPEMVWLKDRNNTGDAGGTNWIAAYTIQDGSSDRLYVNGNNAKFDLSGTEFRVDFDSSNITLGTWNNVNASGPHVGFCFRSIQGYSKFGTFKGNGNVDGPFIYTGFKPAFGIFKRTDTTGNWYMMTGKIGDDGQDGNPLEDRLEANTNAAEADMGQGYDFLSNGVKVRHNGAEINGSGNSFIYMIWAEHPFVSSEGVPTTAR